jgi:hypothetical protein
MFPSRSVAITISRSATDMGLTVWLSPHDSQLPSSVAHTRGHHKVTRLYMAEKQKITSAFSDLAAVDKSSSQLLFPLCCHCLSSSSRAQEKKSQIGDQVSQARLHRVSSQVSLRHFPLYSSRVSWATFPLWCYCSQGSPQQNLLLANKELRNGVNQIGRTICVLRDAACFIVRGICLLPVKILWRDNICPPHHKMCCVTLTSGILFLS